VTGRPSCETRGVGQLGGAAGLCCWVGTVAGGKVGGGGGELRGRLLVMHNTTTQNIKERNHSLTWGSDINIIIFYHTAKG
jgi:hypothetical protein